MKNMFLAIILVMKVYLSLLILSFSAFASDGSSGKNCSEILQASVFEQAVKKLEERFSKLAALLSKEHPEFEFTLKARGIDDWSISEDNSDQDFLFPTEDFLNEDAIASSTDTSFSPWARENLMMSNHIEKISINARRKIDAGEKRPFVTVALYEGENGNIEIDDLQTNSLYSDIDNSMFEIKPQEEHKGISLKSFLRVKHWIIQSFKDAGVISISNSSAVSYEVARFYKYLGMKPVHEAGRLFHEYMEYLYKECRSVNCFVRNDIGSLSKAVSGEIMLMNHEVNSTEVMLSANDRARISSFFYLINESNKSNLDVLTSLSNVVFENSNLQTEVIVDSMGTFLGLRVLKGGVERVRFRTPDAIEALDPDRSKILSWDGIQILALSMSLQD